MTQCRAFNPLIAIFVLTLVVACGGEDSKASGEGGTGGVSSSGKGGEGAGSKDGSAGSSAGGNGANSSGGTGTEAGGSGGAGASTSGGGTGANSNGGAGAGGGGGTGANSSGGTEAGGGGGTGASTSGGGTGAGGSGGTGAGGGGGTGAGGGGGTGGASGNDVCSDEASPLSFYVKPAASGGSDAANGQTLATAWATIQKAAATLTAGQTGCVRSGTYTASTAIQFANQGTSGNARITLRGYPGDTLPVIDRQAVPNGTGTDCSNAHCAAFAILNRDWITLQRLDIRRGDGRNIELRQGSDHFELLDSIIREVVTDDNSGGVSISPDGGGKPDEFYIARNTFHSRQVDSNKSSNGSGIILFHSGDGVIENNDIHDVYTGIYYKHSCETSGAGCPPSDGVVIVRKNRLWNIGGLGGTCSAGCGNAIWWTHHDSLIENNLVFRTTAAGQQSGQMGLAIGVWDGGAGCSDTESNQNIIRWNTVYNAPTSFEVGADSSCRTVQQGNQFLNNIAFGFTSGSEPGFAIWPFGSQAPDLTQTTISFNIAFSSTVSHDAQIVGTSSNLTALPSSILGKVGNLTTQPSFTNVANTDFRLQAGSPGKNAASDGTDMGAFGNGVSCVGNPNATPTPVGC